MGNKLPKASNSTMASNGSELEKQVEGKTSITHYVNKKKIWDNGPVTQPEGSDPDSHNADTFGGEAQNEEADDAVNDETFGGEATFETRHDAHNEEVCHAVPAS